MITHNARMIKHNANILAPHPWQSTWWEWLIDARGVSRCRAKDAALPMQETNELRRLLHCN